MRTYILAANFQIARLAAEILGLRGQGWTYVNERMKVMGLQPSEEVKFVRVWSPPVNLPEPQLEVWDYWERMGYTVEVVNT